MDQSWNADFTQDFHLQNFLELKKAKLLPTGIEFEQLGMWEGEAYP